ncbi:hypothetical protein RF11_10090 [Thelohanellus kitauei]|uniref:Uncharacterized protein n=1 Tax=Thelohanellus kitauei TaxID=669202 RepID=A0A0C2IY90_THEKT|nr:hypothetical protein RF11_10090 [Thelohanellus kitauei]
MYDLLNGTNKNKCYHMLQNKSTRFTGFGRWLNLEDRAPIMLKRIDETKHLPVLGPLYEDEKIELGFLNQNQVKICKTNHFYNLKKGNIISGFLTSYMSKLNFETDDILLDFYRF